MHRKILTIFALFSLAMASWADLPFRLYRYDGFKAHAIDNQSIVFFGNSITNMHEWWEAFGNPHIVNRGVNGAETPIMLQNLESVLVGRPAKIFFMMGTNDLGTQGMNTPAHVAHSVRQAVLRCQKESPETKVYVQSILPCTTNGIKRVEDVPVTNDSLQRICREMNVTYVDLYNDLKGIATYAISKDGTHLTMSGYRIWCRKIAPLVGAECTYPTTATDNDGGLGGISGMRATYFAALPVHDGDILMLGDDGNDWHELLHSDRVKQRGSSWGPTSNSIADLTKMVPNILKGRTDNGEPQAVCLMLGYAEATGSTALSTIATNYEALVKLIRKQAPHAVIKLMAVYPSPTASVNTSRIEPFNNCLRAMADSMERVDFVAGTYSRMVKNGVADPDCFNGVYPYARGYARLSQVVAEALGSETGVKATSEEEVVERKALIDARSVVANAIGTVGSLPVGNGVGQYPPEALQSVTQQTEQSYALLASDATVKELQEAGSKLSDEVNALLPQINQPLSSKQGEEHWYLISSPLRNTRYVTSQGADNQLLGGDNTGYERTMWKFVKRTDGSSDIVNRADGTYINPVATYNTALTTTATRPSKGWKLSYGNTPGTFIISCGQVQLNQTMPALGNLIYNWSQGQSGTDRSDLGCQFAICDAPLPVAEPGQVDDGELEVAMTTGAFNSSGSFGKLWTSQSTQPQLSLSCPNNNMAASGDHLVIYSGISTNTTYTLSVSDGYLIKGYRFKYVNTEANTEGNTLVANGTTYTSTASPQQLTVDGVNAASVSFSQSGMNKGVLLTDFFVHVQRKGYVGIGTPAVQPTVAREHKAYDLKGRRVGHGHRGVIIVNGRKVLKH